MADFTPLSDWKNVCDQLRSLFSGLGKINIDDEGFQYQSQEPYVSTSLALNKDGKLLSKMPLHEIESTFDQIRIENYTIELTGNLGKYTYRIPNEILSILNSE